MSGQAISHLKLVAAVVCLVVGGGLFFSRLREGNRVGEEGARVWFYDESEKELYQVPRDTIPPHKGLAGARNDGVRAVVAAPKGGTRSASERRIASRQEVPAWATCQRNVQNTKRRLQRRSREWAPLSSWARRQREMNAVKTASNWWSVGPRVERRHCRWWAKDPAQSGKSGVMGQC